MRQRGPVTRGVWTASLVLLAAAVATLSSCGDDSITGEDEQDFCTPAHEGPTSGWGVIGPEGGVVEVTDSSSQVFGVAVRVPPGAWNGCWEVFIDFSSTFSTPDYPDGFVPHHGDFVSGSFEILVYRVTPDSTIYAPASLQLYMEISFPLQNIAPADGEMAAIYAYDEAADIWRLVLPDSLRGSAMVLKTNRYDRRWSWGRVVLSDVDFDLYLAPLLEELHGKDEWEQLKVELENLYSSVIASDLALTCANLDLIQDLFRSLNSAARADLEAFQASLAGACGSCDVLTLAFFTGYFEYVTLNIQAFLIEFLLIDEGPNLLIRAYGILELLETWEEIESLACDYECYFGHADPGFSSEVAIYYVTYALVEVLEYAKSVYGCNPVQAGGAATELVTNCGSARP